jgi:ATP synthase protein I
MAAGRRQAQRVVVFQTVVTLIAALVFLVQGERAALAALLGGGAVTLGSALMAWRAFGAGVIGPGAALARLFGGLALKWLVIVGALYIALARFELPPLPLIAGLGAALVAYLMAFRIKS